jgi:hypothetical protein
MSITERLRKLELAAQQGSSGPAHIVVQYGDDAWGPTEANYERVNAAIAREHLPRFAVWFGGYEGKTPDTADTVLARLRDRAA